MDLDLRIVETVWNSLCRKQILWDSLGDSWLAQAAQAGFGDRQLGDNLVEMSGPGAQAGWEGSAASPELLTWDPRV